MVEVMFWAEDNSAIGFGYQSKFWFDTREQAEDFVHGITVENCTAVSFREEGEDAEFYDILDDEEEWDDYDDGYASNMHCDTYGVCGGYNCPNYIKCHI